VSRTRLLLALGLAVSVTACGDDPVATATSATVPEDLVSGVSRLFTGTLAARETWFYSFTVPQASGVFITLASVTATDGRDATATPLQVGLGVPRGTGCATDSTVVATPALTPHLRQYVSAGVRCVSVADPGTLGSPVRFAVRIGYFQ
jgi:hypothetical protein